MKRMITALCCIGLCSMPVLAQKNQKGATMRDQQFVDFAAQTDMVEANLGQLAQNNGSAQSVKDFGHQLTTDHTSDYGALATVAKQANLTLPTAIDAEHNKV